MLFSFLYVRYYQHKSEKEFGIHVRCNRGSHVTGTTAVAMVGMVIALLTTALIPVDIFLVSSFKNSDGTFHVSLFSVCVCVCVCVCAPPIGLS